jgi:hypothetical protein
LQSQIEQKTEESRLENLFKSTETFAKKTGNTKLETTVNVMRESNISPESDVGKGLIKEAIGLQSPLDKLASSIVVDEKGNFTLRQGGSGIDSANTPKAQPVTSLKQTGEGSVEDKGTQLENIKIKSGNITGDVPATKEQLIKQEYNKKIAEDVISSQATAPGTYRFMQQFERSMSELEKFDPSIGETGFSGFITRKKAELANAMDELPETKALQIRIKPMANRMARDVEGGRVTDDDRKIYADSFANAMLEPSATNVRLASESIITLIDKLDGNNEKIIPTLKQISRSNVDIMQKILGQVVEQYPELIKEVYGEEFEVIK